MYEAHSITQAALNREGALLDARALEAMFDQQRLRDGGRAASGIDHVEEHHCDLPLVLEHFTGLGAQ